MPNSHGGRSPTPVAVPHPVLEAESGAHALGALGPPLTGEEPTKALTCDADGTPVMLASLLQEMRDEALGIEKNGGDDELSRLLRGPNRRPTRADGRPVAEMAMLTTDELNAIFPPEMQETHTPKPTLDALDHAQAAAPSAVTSETPAFNDFSVGLTVDTKQGTRAEKPQVERPRAATPDAPEAVVDVPTGASRARRAGRLSLAPALLAAGALAALATTIALLAV